MATYEETFNALSEAFAALVGAGDVDVANDDAGGIDVMADAWTLHVEGWPGPELAWLAHDVEPNTYDEDTIRVTLPETVLMAFAEADQSLDGSLSAALLASDDPLSVGLAGIIG